MALALPQLLQAGSHQSPPTKVGLANLKVPAALVPTKPGSVDPQATVPKTKFQALLDQLAQAAKGGAETAPATGDKLKAPKAKTAEPVVEKVKEPKKAEAKESKHPEVDGNLVAALQVSPKTEAAPKAAAKVTDAETALAADKAKTSVRDRRTGQEMGVPAPVTAAAAEVARAQAQQNAPRSERTEEKQMVFVVDRRTDTKEKEKLKLPGAEGSANQPVNAPVELQVPTKPNDPKTTAAEVQVTFQSVSGKSKEGFDLKGQSAPVSPRDALSFQQYLVERGYGQLVDQARIVLKDQNAGEIRMTLYPESLGKVKVSLDLSDNSLAGQIYVENQTVKDVFQSNLEGLMEAFREGGWDNMSLEVSVGNGNGGKQSGERHAQAAPQARDYDRQVVSAPVEGRSLDTWNNRQINLTA